MKPHRRKPQRPRTDEERAISIASRTETAINVYARKVLGKPIGQYSIGELPELYRALIEKGENTFDTVFVRKIIEYIIATREK